MVSGVLHSGSGSVAGALHNCSRSNGLSARSVGSSPMRLLVRFSGISSSDDGDGESLNCHIFQRFLFMSLWSFRGCLASWERQETAAQLCYNFEESILTLKQLFVWLLCYW